MMTKDQLEQLKENYANFIVDGMDMNTLCTFAIETILDLMETWDEQDVKEEIVDLYGEETFNDLSA